MQHNIGIIDYGIGNLQSVFYAVRSVGGVPHFVNSVDAMLDCDALILPGVGAFPHVEKAFRKSGLRDGVLRRVKENVPILGICVGMQLLYDESYEFGLTRGLGILQGKVKRIEANDLLPVIGWFRTEDLDPSSRGYYFLHSYCVSPENNDDVLQTYSYGGTKIVASVSRGNVMGTQYHPERSGSDGLRILHSFVRYGKLLVP